MIKIFGIECLSAGDAVVGVDLEHGGDEVHELCVVVVVLPAGPVGEVPGPGDLVPAVLGLARAVPVVVAAVLALVEHVLLERAARVLGHPVGELAADLLDEGHVLELVLARGKEDLAGVEFHEDAPEAPHVAGTGPPAALELHFRGAVLPGVDDEVVRFVVVHRPSEVDDLQVQTRGRQVPLARG